MIGRGAYERTRCRDRASSQHHPKYGERCGCHDPARPRTDLLESLRSSGGMRDILVAYAGSAVVTGALPRSAKVAPRSRPMRSENEHLRLDLVDDDERQASIVARTHHRIRDTTRASSDATSSRKSAVCGRPADDKESGGAEAAMASLTAAAASLIGGKFGVSSREARAGDAAGPGPVECPTNCNPNHQSAAIRFRTLVTIRLARVFPRQNALTGWPGFSRVLITNGHGSEQNATRQRWRRLRCAR